MLNQNKLTYYAEHYINTIFTHLCFHLFFCTTFHAKSQFFSRTIKSVLDFFNLYILFVSKNQHIKKY